MDAQAHGQVHPPLLLQARIQLSQGLHHPQPGPHRPLRVIFVRQGVAEVDEQTIAEILRDMAVKAGDHLGAGLLIGPHHLAPVFGVELAGEHGRIHQITEQHRELAAFGVGRTRLGGRGCGLWPAIVSSGWLVRLRLSQWIVTVPVVHPPRPGRCRPRPRPAAWA